MSQNTASKLSASQNRQAIAALNKRLEDLKVFKSQLPTTQYSSEAQVLTDKINSTLERIYGANSTQFARHALDSLYLGALSFYSDPPPNEIREEYERGVRRAEATLQTLIDLCEEELEEGGEDPATRSRRAFGDLDLHPEIARRTTKLFENGHYANAVEDACKVLELMVKMRSGVDDRSGVKLMTFVFSPKKPVLAFNDGRNESEQSEREGMLHLYTGAVQALRNPRAHDLLDDSAERAVEYIGFVSLLTKLLDETEIVEAP